MMKLRRLGRVAVLALAPALWACGGRDNEPVVDTTPGTVTTDAVRVTNVELGSAIDADRRIADDRDTDDFRATDTVYAAVETDGNASGASLTARWTFEDGQVVDETTQTVAGSGPAVTEFHIAQPGGLPVGRYQVEILLNGQSVERKDFQVR